MIKEQLEIKVIENVRQIINYIANEEYSKLHTITSVDSSWCKESETQIEGIKKFGEWLKWQLEIWSEYEEKEFVIDTFNEKYLNIDAYKGNCIFATFFPRSNGEEIELWFEFEFTVDENDEMTSMFNVNM